MLITMREILDILLMTAVVGFIFMPFFAKITKKKEDDLLSIKKTKFDWRAFGFSVAVVAPAIILHEFGHKFMGMAFGMTATFHAAYTWLLIGLALRVMGAPFIFFVPAFVSLGNAPSPAIHSLVAFAGPGVNLILWLTAFILLKTNITKPEWKPFLILTARVNLFLFIFNMLPLPFFDGFHVFSNLISAVF